MKGHTKRVRKNLNLDGIFTDHSSSNSQNLKIDILFCIMNFVYQNVLTFHFR